MNILLKFIHQAARSMTPNADNFAPYLDSSGFGNVLLTLLVYVDLKTDLLPLRTLKICQCQLESVSE